MTQLYASLQHTSTLFLRNQTINKAPVPVTLRSMGKVLCAHFGENIL